MNNGSELVLAPPAQRVDVLSVPSGFSDDSFAPGAAPPTTAITTVLRRRWLTMLLVALVAAGSGCAAILYFFSPLFQVEAIVQIASVVRPIMFSDADSDISRQYESYVSTESMAMTSPPVVQSALNSPDVRSLPLILASPNAVEFVQKNTKIERVGHTQLLRVIMTGREAEQLAVIVNSLVLSYVRWHDENKRAWDDKILRSLRKEEAELKAQLTAKSTELRQFAAEGGLTSGSDKDQAVDGWIKEIQGLLSQAIRQRAIISSRLRAIEQEAGGVQIDPQGFQEFTQGDAMLQEARTKLRTLEFAAVDDARMGRGPDHPDVAGRDARIVSLRATVEDRETQLREIYAVALKRRLAGELLDAEADVKVFQEELDRLTKQRGELSRQIFVLDDIRHERERVEAALVSVRENIWRTEVEQNRMSRVTLDSPAVAPAVPNVDKRAKYIIAVCMMSLFLGVGAALVKERMDGSVRDPVEVTARLGMPLLGSVQRVPNMNGPGLLCDARVMEPLRGIATALLSASDDKQHHRWLLTSPTARSGKTSMAINLAQCLASTGRRVLLVDADNIGRGVTRAFDLLTRPGLNELLAGKSSPKKVIVSVDAENLSVLPAGKREQEFSDRISRKQSRELLLEIFAEYDGVIVDSPPVLMSSHTVVLATLVDEIVLVLRAGTSTRDEAVTARRKLASVGGKLVGVILNAVHPRHSPYAYYGYAYPEENAS
jgi:capsular exopolysaccharide synthesis family protein